MPRMPRRRPRTLAAVAFILAVLAAVGASAVAGMRGGAITGALILLVMVAGSLLIAAR